MKKILLIEHHNETRTNIAHLLELAGYAALTATNGKEGIELAMAQLPDLIISDIAMPIVDGYGVLHMLHNNNILKNTPFIFLSEKSGREEIRKGMEMGADDYITKPFETTELLKAIESRLKRAAQLRRAHASSLIRTPMHLSATISKDLLDTMGNDHDILLYKKKQLVYQYGHHPVRLYYILKGKIRTYKRNEEGKELIIGLYDEGDFLGYTALLEQRTYREFAEVLEDADLLVIPAEDFGALLINNPVIMHKFMQLLSKSVTEKEEQLLGIAYNSLRKKVSTAILSLYYKYNPDNDAAFCIDMSRDSLAALTGVAKESLIRTLGDFRDEKMIILKDGQIIIVNRKKLEDLIS